VNPDEIAIGEPGLDLLTDAERDEVAEAKARYLSQIKAAFANVDDPAAEDKAQAAQREFQAAIDKFAENFRKRVEAGAPPFPH
jgi:hypothetical protein